MKTKLIALLKTSFASKGFNAKDLESLADLVIAQNLITDQSTDEDLITAVTGAKQTADVIQSIASRQVADAVKPKPVEAPKAEEQAKTDVDPNENENAKLLRLALEGITKLTAEVATIKGEKVATTLYGTAEQRLKAKYADYPEILADVLLDVKERSFQDEETLNSFLDRKEAALGVIIQAGADQGLGGDRPTGGVGGSNSSTKKEATEAEVEAAFSNLRI